MRHREGRQAQETFNPARGDTRQHLPDGATHPTKCHHGALTLSHSGIVSAGGCPLGVPILLRVTLLHSFHRRHLVSTHHLQGAVLVYPELY